MPIYQETWERGKGITESHILTTGPHRILNDQTSIGINVYQDGKVGSLLQTIEGDPEDIILDCITEEPTTDLRENHTYEIVMLPHEGVSLVSVSDGPNNREVRVVYKAK